MIDKFLCLNCSKEVCKDRLRKPYKNKKKFCSIKCSNNFYDRNHREMRRLKEKARRDKLKPNRKIRTKRNSSQIRFSSLKYQKEWKEKNPKKYKEQLKKKHLKERANPILRNAYKNDYRKKDTQCYLCGSNEKLQFHHKDYKEHKGITLCSDCHRKLHKVKRLFKREVITNNN